MLTLMLLLDDVNLLNHGSVSDCCYVQSLSRLIKICKMVSYKIKALFSRGGILSSIFFLYLSWKNGSLVSDL